MPTPQNVGPVALTDLELFPRAAGERTWREALGSLGLVATPENIAAFGKRATHEQIDISEMRSRRPTDDISTDELQRAVDGAKTRAPVLRRLHLQAAGSTYKWLAEVCAARSIGMTWCGQPIPLELDHINGDPTDNRLANLRLLCPNCHALTPTYRGRNIGRNRKIAS